MYETRIIVKRCQNMPQKFEMYYLCVCVEPLIIKHIEK